MSAWHVVIDGEPEDVYLDGDEIVISGFTRLTPNEAQSLVIALLSACVAAGEL